MFYKGVIERSPRGTSRELKVNGENVQKEKGCVKNSPGEN
jgi:hypothetical protein